MRPGSSVRPESAAIALGVDALGEPQSHQQEFVGALFAVEAIVDHDAMAVGLDAHQPGLGTLFGGDGVPDAVDIEAAMGAGTDAGIFLAAPVDQIVPALRAGPGVVGNLVGRQALLGADLLRDVVERARRPLHPGSSACRRRAGRRTACLPRSSVDRATDARRLPRSRASVRPPTSAASGRDGRRSDRTSSGRTRCARSRPRRAPRARCAGVRAPSARHRPAPARRARPG